MRVRDRGFALILVLVATATVFTLAIQSGVMVRATTIEVTVLREREQAQRGAHGAAALLIKSLLQPGAAVADPNAPGAGDAEPAHVAAQLGVDLFNGEGWETFDRGEKTPPRPDN